MIITLIVKFKKSNFEKREKAFYYFFAHSNSRKDKINNVTTQDNLSK